MEAEFSDGMPESWKEALESLDDGLYAEKNFPDLYKFKKSPVPI